MSLFHHHNSPANALRVGLIQALALMKQAFRAGPTVALVATTIATFIPFNQPLNVSFEMASPPIWIPIAGLVVLVGVPLALLSAVGLYRFKRWSRPLGLAVGVLFIAAFGLLTIKSPFLGLMAPTAIAMDIVAAIAWFGSIALSYSKQLAKHFDS